MRYFIFFVNQNEYNFYLKWYPWNGPKRIKVAIVLKIITFRVVRFLPVYLILIQPRYFHLRFFIEYNSFDIFDIVLFLHPGVEQLTDRKVNTLQVLVRRLSAEYWVARSLRQQIRDTDFKPGPFIQRRFPNHRFRLTPGNTDQRYTESFRWRRKSCLQRPQGYSMQCYDVTMTTKVPLRLF